MTTNHLIGLISSICLGLVILWTLFRKDKKVYLKNYNSTPSYGTENGTIHVVPGHPYLYTWNDGSELKDTNKEMTRKLMFAKVQQNEIKLSDWLKFDRAIDGFPDNFTIESSKVISELLDAISKRSRPEIEQAFLNFVLYGEGWQKNEKVKSWIREQELDVINNWKKVQTREEYENRPSDTDLATHSKVLEDIKKVEKLND